MGLCFPYARKKNKATKETMSSRKKWLYKEEIQDMTTGECRDLIVADQTATNAFYLELSPTKMSQHIWPQISSFMPWHGSYFLTFCILMKRCRRSTSVFSISLMFVSLISGPFQMWKLFSSLCIILPSNHRTIAGRKQNLLGGDEIIQNNIHYFHTFVCAN